MPIQLIILIVISLVILGMYNSIVKLKNKVKQARSGIDVYLNERFDLIPNLVECVKAYSKHEKNIIENITKMRADYIGTKKKDIKSAERLNNNINKLICLIENYPQLKASEQYLNLQKSLSKTESQLQAARRIYNMEVTNYNTKISVVPNNLIAKIFGFKEEKLFEIEENVAENIDINFEG